MATVSTSLARGAFASSIQDIYTVPTTGTTAIITNIVVVNTGASEGSFNILLDSVELFSGTIIAGKSTISVDMKQVLNSSPTPKKIRGFASSNAIKVHISGIEIA